MPDLTEPTDLAGKVALVTGGSRGIGAGIAGRLAAGGADVAVTYRNAGERAEAVVATIQAGGRRGMAIKADAADAGAAQAAVDQTMTGFGRIDILVNNAGLFPYGPLDDVSVDELDHALAVHTRAAFLAAQAAARYMGTDGRIITIGSNLADRVPAPGMTLYVMTKAALGGLTRGLARDLGPQGITANLVQPGSTDTEMNPADGPDADAERAATALGRYGTVDDVAATVAFLAGPGGRQITGATITVDGGANA